MLATRLQAIGGTRTLTSPDSQHCRLLLRAPGTYQVNFVDITDQVIGGGTVFEYHTPADSSLYSSNVSIVVTPEPNSGPMVGAFSTVREQSVCAGGFLEFSRYTARTGRLDDLRTRTVKYRTEMRDTTCDSPKTLADFHAR
jgi:hypothetical protein